VTSRAVNTSVSVSVLGSIIIHLVHCPHTQDTVDV
jgi:hypothetical protein